MPKVWMKDEILKVMKDEWTATVNDAIESGRPRPNADELIDLMFLALDGNGLIQYEPWSSRPASGSLYTNDKGRQPSDTGPAFGEGEVSEWQPIETAPKNGELFLCLIDGLPYAARYDEHGRFIWYWHSDAASGVTPADRPTAVAELAALSAALATLEGIAAPGEAPTDAVEAYVRGPLPDCMMPDGGQACVAYQQLHAAFAEAETDAFLRGRQSGRNLAELEAKYGSFHAGDSPSPQQPTQETPQTVRDLLAARFAAQRVTAAPVSGTPTDDELEALIKPLWMAAKPSHEAQSIRASLSAAFDDPKYRQWVSDFIPDYVWDLVDVAAQRGMTAAADKARREALEAVKAIPRWGSLSFEVKDQLVRALTPQNPGDAAPESE